MMRFSTWASSSPGALQGDKPVSVRGQGEPCSSGGQPSTRTGLRGREKLGLKGSARGRTGTLQCQPPRTDWEGVTQGPPGAWAGPVGLWASEAQCSPGHGGCQGCGDGSQASPQLREPR